jgi:hypothetical protein
MDGVTYVARGCFSLALIISLLSTFFTCLQQRTYGFVEEPGAIRAWLSNGVQYYNNEGKKVFQSSSVSHNLLQIPFELLCISITCFLIGYTVYLASSWAEDLPQGLAAEQKLGNPGVMIAFAIGTVFALILLGQILGTKDVERNRFLNQDEEGIRIDVKDGSGIPPTLEAPSFTPLKMKTALVAAVERSKLTSSGSSGEREKSSDLAQALRRAADAQREAAAAVAELAGFLENMSQNT